MIAIFGGTFDPIHNGHMQIAKQVFARLDLDQIQFMPSALPVHRNQPRASAAHRCAMIDLEIASRPGFVLSRLEIDRNGPSYSIDSLQEIRRYSKAVLALVLGSDAFNGFAKWKMPLEILQMAHLIVCHRPDVECNTDLFSEHRVDSISELQNQSAGAIVTLEVDANDCSSSQVRATLAAGEKPSQCISPAVASYIGSHQLYRNLND